ncbi:MAG: DUF1588 domain-containing protein [Deltaproteobacteria bacterium]|nr:DUF1588 domain-containing protein [Deltaproteobacteria bacterium]
MKSVSPSKSPFGFGPRFARLMGPGVATIGLSAVMACEEPLKTEIPAENCVSDIDFFEEDIWRGFMASDCYACHNVQGSANTSELVLQSQNQPGYLKANFKMVRDLAVFERDGESLIYLKPSAQVDHGGGEVIAIDGPEYTALQALVERYKTPVDCGDEVVTDFYADVEFSAPGETLRRASINLLGRLPTENELAQVASGDEADIDAVLDGMLSEEAFFSRLKEIYNDGFLTDRYLERDNATNLLTDEDFPERRFYNDLDDDPRADPLYIDLANDHTNDSVARAPLELIAHLAREELPFTQVISADYVMVNPFSARVYGIDDIAWDDANDPNEWREGQIADYPHAGVLSDPMWLNRFPTTETNRNRHRARMVYSFFLATDIMRLAERPVDSTAIVEFNPTMYNPSCAVCHANMDPVAGAFQNFDQQGRYNPPEGGWYSDMRPPGFGEETLPSGEWGTALQWLGGEIGKSELFDLAITQTLYTGITGQFPQVPPTDLTEGDVDALFAAYEAERAEHEGIAKAFRDSNHNIKVLVKELVKSKSFRSKTIRSDAARPEYLALGSGRWQTPELLHRKIAATTGWEWQRDASRRYLLSENEFLIFYGGINSDTVTQRINEPNGLMSSIALRMSNEVACRVVTDDFTRLKEDRLLLPFVERSFEPEDLNGFEIQGGTAAIKANIVYLHQRFLGEELDVGGEEVERTFQLFLETWREGKAAMEEETISASLNSRCRRTTDLATDEELEGERRVDRDEAYTVRAWRAVVTYLMQDYRFLHD